MKSADSYSIQLIQLAPPFIDGDTDEEEDVVKRDDRRAPDQKTVFPTHCIADQALKENFYSLLAVPFEMALRRRSLRIYELFVWPLN